MTIHLRFNAAANIIGTYSILQSVGASALYSNTEVCCEPF